MAGEGQQPVAVPLSLDVTAEPKILKETPVSVLIYGGGILGLTGSDFSKRRAERTR